LAIAIVKGAPVASRVLLLLAIARFTSSEDLARASYAIAVAEAIKVLGDLGTETWAIRAIGQAPGAEAISRTTSSMAVVKTALGIIGGIAAALITFEAGGGGVLLAAVSGVLVLVGEIFGIGVIFHLARSTSRELVGISATTGFVVVVVGVIALAQGMPTDGVCALIAAGETVAAALVLAQLRRSGMLGLFPGIFDSTLQVSRQLLPTAAYSGVVAISSRLDTMALNAFSSQALATYTVAFRAIQPFSFALGAAALALYSAQFSKGPGNGGRELRAPVRPLWIVFAAALAAALGTFELCAWLIARFVPAYAGSLPVLRILCALLPIVAINNVCFYMLAGRGQFSTILGVVSINLLATAGLLGLLVPSLGASGAAMALLGAALLSAIALFWQVFRPRLAQQAVG
jgi:O-antigen/teichoic acid export membrane protein